jgi:hypothetical protein
MRGSGKLLIGLLSPIVVSLWVIACSSVQEQPSTSAPASTPPAPQAKAPTPSAPAKAAEAKGEPAKGSAKTKAVEVEGVISGVGQRTITFQVERKGKVREEVVGVDDKTKIEKGGANVKLRDLQETDQALINYEPEAYTPAIAIKVIGKGTIQKVGGED